MSNFEFRKYEKMYSLIWNWNPLAYEVTFVQVLLKALEDSSLQEFALMLAYLQEHGTSKGLLPNKQGFFKPQSLKNRILSKNKITAQTILEKILIKTDGVSLPDLVDMVTIQSNLSLQFIEKGEALLVSSKVNANCPF